MKTETKQLAREIFVAVMPTAHGLGGLTKEERNEMLKEVAEICFEAAVAFEKVEENIG